MLAKLWKKVLLAVCILACLFNITSKLVNRNSLEVNLKSANDGNTVFDFTRKDKEELTSPVAEENSVSENTIENNVTVETNANDTVTEENTDTNNEVSSSENQNESEEESNNNSGGFKYKDITFIEL